MCRAPSKKGCCISCVTPIGSYFVHGKQELKHELHPLLQGTSIHNQQAYQTMIIKHLRCFPALLGTGLIIAYWASSFMSKTPKSSMATNLNRSPRQREAGKPVTTIQDVYISKLNICSDESSYEVLRRISPGRASSGTSQ